LLYTGTATVTHEVRGLNFQPDLVWMKSRSGTANHAICDSVRGTQKILSPSTSSAETIETTGGLTGFEMGGFTVAEHAQAQGHTNTGNMVAWCWKAGNETTVNNDGTHQSVISVNQDAGFSIVSFNTPNATTDMSVGHGLGKKPALVMMKNRNQAASAWFVWHKNLSVESYYLYLHDTHDEGDLTQDANAWGNQSFTDKTISTRSGWSMIADRQTIAYCWTDIDGYSKFGAYKGNGSADGPFVYLGFKPAFILTKRTDVNSPWRVFDNKRPTYNGLTFKLQADDDSTEYTSSVYVDFLSNGFKVRDDGSYQNASGGDYIYMAIAEMPFKYANAR